MPSLAVFVTPHGFGHAARAAAVMEAIRAIRPDVRFEIFTLVPAWFFADSLGDGFRHHPLRVDVGLVQKTTHEEDPQATLIELQRFVPFDAAAVRLLADGLRALGCDAVMADISPLGIEVGHAAGLPTVLVESFTWDWIYASYLPLVPELAQPIEVLATSLMRATWRVRCEPACGQVRSDLVVPPVSRRPRHGREQTRQDLAVHARRPLVLLTMGGIAWVPDTLAPLASRPDVTFVIPGGAATTRIESNVMLLPHHSTFYHPDLIAAADAVVCKLGYSTVSEAFRAGVPVGYVPRQHFPESPYLERFVQRHMAGLPISLTDARTCAWVEHLDSLLAMPRVRANEGGAEAAAAFVVASLVRERIWEDSE